MAKNLSIFSSSRDPSRSISSLAKKHRKPLLIISLSSLLLLVAIVAVTASVSRRSKNSENASLTAESHALLRASCSSTLYPELCFSSIATNPSLAASLASQQDIIEASLNITILAVEGNYFKVKKLIKRKDLTPREECALHDCLIDIDQTLDELKKTYDDLKVYPSNKTLSRQAEDLKILMSAAMTDQESCLDGFSHSDADKKVRKVLEKGIVHVEKMLSNALAMICNMTDTHIALERAKNSRRLEEEDDAVEDDEFPKWLSAGDRKLLQSPSVKADVTVAADGSGNYRTIAQAVAAAPEKSSKRYVIRIKAGVYRENLEVPKKKTNLMFVGDGRKTTIITASRNVKDGSTTFNSATVAVVGDGFLAQDITFQNTAGPSKGQAVALRVGSDLSAFYRCDMLAYQDTLYVHSLRQFYHSCLVVGTVDFIFGNGAVVLQGCNIHARRPNPGQGNMVTAQGRSDRNQNTGIVIQNCRIDGTSDLIPVKNSVKTFLGRPWREYSRTVVMKSEITDVIRPEGWSAWSGNFALDTLYYAEYQNRGTGAGTSGRVKWKGFKVITNAAEAEQFTAGRFIAGGSWLRATGFPFTLGL